MQHMFCTSDSIQTPVTGPSESRRQLCESLRPNVNYNRIKTTYIMFCNEANENLMIILRPPENFCPPKFGSSKRNQCSACQKMLTDS